MILKAPEYPLDQILGVKKKRVEEAQREVVNKQEALKKEEQELLKVEKKRDEVKNHKQEKLDQLVTTLNEGTTSDEVLQMKAYLEVVEEKLQDAEQKVQNQKQAVETAKQNLEVAKEDLHKKRKEVDKLEMHRKKWLKKEEKELARKDQLQQDEIGQTIFLQRYGKKK